MREKGLINALILCGVVILLGVILLNDNKDRLFGSKLIRNCPQAWYEDRMPTVIEDRRTELQYFVYKGERRELSEFDVDWVKKNCGLWPEQVY